MDIADELTTALDRRVDPISQAREYQDLLVGLVGERDPAQVQGELGAQLRAIVTDSGPHVRTKPAPDEWSVIELLGHTVDAELVSAARYRWILAQDQPTLVGYDQDLWVQRLGYRQADPDELMGQFLALRRANLDLWTRTSETDRARVGMHAERGPESFDLTFRLAAGHGLFHTAQMRRTLDAVQAGGGEAATSG